MIIYVNAAAAREGNGTKEMPFRHINDAAKAAMPGDEVVVAPGVYREYVDPVNAGTEDNRIVYRSEVPLGAVITGAEAAKGWEKYEGTTWVLRVDNGIFGEYNPYTTLINGDWYFSKIKRHAGAVYLNDRAFYEAVTLEECIKGEVYKASWEPEYSIYKWYTEQDGNETVIYANFHGKNPNEENVEINVRRNCFFPSKTGVNYITFSGFNVNKAATTWAPPASFQDGMIGPHWSKGWIIEDCDISNSKCAGISLGKYLDPENNQYFSNKLVKSATQMERDAVCRGQYHGWLKEKVGSHIVRRCNIHHCEQTGIVGRMGCVFSTIEDNHIHHINNMHELGGAEIAGIKLHAAIDVTFRRNHIHHCTMGIWCDWQAQGTRITQNLLHDNNYPEGWDGGEDHYMENQDVFVEVSHGPTLIDNNIMLSDCSVRLAAEGVALVHNLIAGSFTGVGGGWTDEVVEGINQARYTPYHIRHRTEVAGFMTILHGDDRLYNNIFLKVRPEYEWPFPSDYDDPAEHDRIEGVTCMGTGAFDIFPTYEVWKEPFTPGKFESMFDLTKYHFGKLPAWLEGNAYFGGASVCKNEKNGLVDDKSEVYVRLVEKDGKYSIETNVYELMGDFKAGIVNSDILGYAFEPEQRFENTDGTDITFDSDYLGEHRGISTIPGPFASGEAAKKQVW